MKKLKKVLALASAFMLLSSVYFTSCAGDDDDDNNNGTPTTSGKSDKQPGQDSGNPSSGGETATAYTVSFTGENSNGNTSSHANGVYTITLANANSEDWQNQIFIKNPNTAAGLSAGDKIHATITAKADKAITKFVFKDQFNGGTYSGIHNLESIQGLEANVAKKFDIYGTVTSDYDSSSSYVIDLRGNEAGTTLVLSEIKVEKLGNYTPSELKIKANSTSVSVGENVTFTTTDQYGFTLEGITYEIVSANSVSTLSGTVLTAGNTAETVTVKASLGDLTKTIDIIVTSNKDYGKYFTAENAGNNSEVAAKGTPGYLFLWSQDTLSDVTTSEKEYVFTRSSKSEWWGTQVFYAAEKGKYAVTFNVTSSVAGKITVNNTAYELSADTVKKIAFIKELAGTDTLISVQLGVNGVGPIDEGTFKISDFSVTEITDLDLSTITVESVEISPATKTISAGEKVTFSAKINDLYPVTDAVYSIASEEGISGSAINGSEFTAGTPTGETGTVKVTATYGGKTSEAAVVTVLAGKDYSKYFKVGSQFGANDPFDNDYLALWYVAGDWGCGDIVSITSAAATETGCSVTRANTGSNDWSTQILYKAAAGTYKVSFKAKSTETGKIAVLPAANADKKQVVTLAADTVSDEITFTATLAEDNKVLMQINLGGDADNILPAGTFTVSDFSVVPANPESGEGTGSGSSTTIDWSKIDWLGNGSGDSANDSKYKISAEGMNIVNIQKPGFAAEVSIYMHGEGGISECTLGTDGTDYKIDGAGIALYLSKFTAKETKFTVTNTAGTHNVVVYNKDGTEN